mmetsp:Transcript_14753/g.59950  ORF Transcript_14753/g.59950 Transcript_14753/m.59950 type:complete len:116 (+) Transcript_14753:2343-2690(+)
MSASELDVPVNGRRMRLRASSASIVSCLANIAERASESSTVSKLESSQARCCDSRSSDCRHLEINWRTWFGRKSLWVKPPTKVARRWYRSYAPARYSPPQPVLPQLPSRTTSQQK